MAGAKRFVYVLNSTADPTRYYTGLTSNVHARLADHNDGRCEHTVTGRPWRVIVVVAFADEKRATEFEQYLKSGSGCAFARRHFRCPANASGLEEERSFDDDHDPRARDDDR